MTELIVAEDLKAIAIFNENGMESVIVKIRTKVTSVILDVNKKKDRDLMRSNAANVAKAKVKLDELGKGLTEEWKLQSKAVDESRKSMRNEMDDLRDEVRAPLTKWENDEKEKLANQEKTFEYIVSLSKAINPETELHYTAEELKANLASLANSVVDESLGKLELACIKAKQKSHDKLVTLIQDAEKLAADRIEFARLQKEAEDLAQIASDAKIASDAVESARIELANEKMAAEHGEAIAINSLIDAEINAKQAVIDADIKAKADAKKAADNLLAQAEQAKIDSAAAVQAEIDSQKAIKDAEISDTKKREANKAHKKRVNNETMQCFIDGGLSEENAKLAVTLLAKKVIKNAQINY